MRIGSLTVELLSEGRFEIFRDGHINRAPDEESRRPPFHGEHQSYDLGINPVLIQKKDVNILLDPGLGWGLDAGSTYHNISNVRTNLAIFGLHPEDISHVVFSHLHYDHIAGCSYVDSDAKTRLMFPNAVHYLHQKEWDYALSQLESSSSLAKGYHLDEFYRLMAEDRVQLLTGDRNTLLEGITACRTGGHTPGHLLMYLESGTETAYYPGDLLPCSSQLNFYGMQSLDVNPLQAKKQKIRMLQRAHEEQAILLLYHSKKGQTGRLIRDEDKQYILTDLPQGE